MDFAVKILKMTDDIKGHYSLINQLERSATPIGANIREVKYGVMSMSLRILEYLDNIEEFNGVAISAKLCCTCGDCFFTFSHTGKQTKGILAPYIIRKNKQLVLQAKCRSCGKTIEVFNSQLDGTRAKPQAETYKLTAFVLPKSNIAEFEVVVKYNYFPEKIKENGLYSNNFENCFIYIVNDGKEGKALIEE